MTFQALSSLCYSSPLRFFRGGFFFELVQSKREGKSQGSTQAIASTIKTSSIEICGSSVIRLKVGASPTEGEYMKIYQN